MPMVRRMPILPMFIFIGIVLMSGLLVHIVQWQVAANAQVPVVPPPTPSSTPTQLPPSATPQPVANAALWFPGTIVEPTSTTPQPVANAALWFPGTIVEPSATPTATLSAVAMESLVSEPTALLGATIESTVVSTSFQPGESNFMHNVLVALNANNGALRRVVVPPGETFSFVQTLGPDPVHLPWRNVFVQYGNRQDTLAATPGPAIARATNLDDNAPYYAARFPISTRVPGDAPPDTPLTPVEPPLLQPTLNIVPVPPVYTEPMPGSSVEPSPPPPPPPSPLPTEVPSATPEPEKPPEPIFVPVLGGGVCDLASRYVIATRPLLPDEAYRFKLHPNGLQGIANRDAVSIWFEGRSTDLDLRITNTTDKWLMLVAEIKEGIVTINAALYSGPPTEEDQARLSKRYLAAPRVDERLLPSETPTPAMN